MADISVINLQETFESSRLDAEFYRNIPKENPKLQYKKIKDILTFVQYGISIEMNENGEGYRIYRMNEIEGMFCIPDVLKFANIPEKEMEKFKLKDRDVLFNRTNSFEFVGRTGLFREFSKEPYVFASYLVRVRPDKKTILPEYLVAFLNCKYGVADIKRRARISINQSNVSAQELQSIRIPQAPMELQERIKESFDESFKQLEEARKIYHESEEILMKEMGFGEFKELHEISFVKNSKDVIKSGRIDAEYFQPKYERILEQIKKYPNGYSNLSQIISIKDKNFTPEASEEYEYIELSNIIGNGKIDNCTIEEGENLPTRARRLVKEGDIIISSIEGSLQSCALITSEHDKSLCSTGFYVLDSDKINPETLLVMFKSPPFQALLKRGCSGTILTAINKDELNKIEIPIIDQSIQNEIAKKINECYKLRQMAKSLLNKSILQVENFIEN